MEIILCGSFPGGSLLGKSFPGGGFLDGSFPGGNYPRWEFSGTRKLYVVNETSIVQSGLAIPVQYKFRINECGSHGKPLLPMPFGS